MDTFKIKVKEKMSQRIEHSNVGMLLLTNNALALLRQEACKINTSCCTQYGF